MVRFEKGRIRLAAAFSLMGVAAAFFAACGGSSATATPQPTATQAAPSKLVVALAAVGGSGQSGEAVLTSLGDQTEVVINVKPGPAGVAQPDHIHEKDCTLPPRVTYPLNNVVDGKSTTVVNASLATLQSRQFAVCVHKSTKGEEALIYVAEGQIPLAPGATSASPATGGGTPSSPGYGY